MQCSLLKNALESASVGTDAGRVEAMLNQTLKIKFFDDMEGLDPIIHEFLEKKVLTVKHDFDFELAKSRCENRSMSDKIHKYKQLTPDTYHMLEMSLDEIFKAI